MRGTDTQQSGMFSYLSAEERVPEQHPLRAIRRMTDEVLKGLSAKFHALYSATGRPSIAPEKLLRALLLQVLYTVRSERLLMEQLQYNLLFRWFVGLNMDEPVWVATVFTKNRERLLEGEIASLFFSGVLAQARSANLLSDEHFSVDGTLIEAWAGQKSFQHKDRSENTPRMIQAIPRWTFTARRVAMIRTSHGRMPMRGWHARAVGTRRSWPIAATC